MERRRRERPVQGRGEERDVRALGYTTAAPPSRYPFPNAPADIWAKLTDSTDGDVAVTIQRFDGTKAYKAKTQTWRIAPGSLKGSIYYTRLVNGDSFVRRIEPGKNASKFLDWI